MQELDRYAKVLNTYTIRNGKRHIDRAGYLPLEPGWYIDDTCFWFGGRLFDEETGKFTMTDPRVVKAYEWIQSYSREMGSEMMSEFQSGVGGFNSAQNAFLVGKVVMEQQGPWMANYIYQLKPEMSEVLMSQAEAMKLPRAERLKNYAWAAVPFPSAVPGLEMVTRCGFDALVIPRGAKHKNEAFEFMAYVNRQPVMEKLCSLHCKNSPLRSVSRGFIENHPNPYIEVFEGAGFQPKRPDVAADSDPSGGARGTGQHDPTDLPIEKGACRDPAANRRKDCSASSMNTSTDSGGGPNCNDPSPAKRNDQGLPVHLAVAGGVSGVYGDPGFSVVSLQPDRLRP